MIKRILKFFKKWLEKFNEECEFERQYRINEVARGRQN